MAYVVVRFMLGERTLRHYVVCYAMMRHDALFSVALCCVVSCDVLVCYDKSWCGI